MQSIQVPDMMCENCVRRIREGLSAAGVKAQVDLAQKTVTVEGDAAEVQAARSALEDLGFSPAPPASL